MNKPSFMWRELAALAGIVTLMILVMPAIMGFLAGFLADISLPRMHTAIFAISAMVSGFILLVASSLAMQAIKDFVVSPALRSRQQKRQMPKSKRDRYALRLHVTNAGLSVSLGLAAYLLADQLNGIFPQGVNEKVFALWSMMISAVTALSVSAFSFLIIDHFIVDEKVRAAQNMNKFEKGKL